MTVRALKVRPFVVRLTLKAVPKLSVVECWNAVLGDGMLHFACKQFPVRVLSVKCVAARTDEQSALGSGESSAKCMCLGNDLCRIDLAKVTREVLACVKHDEDVWEAIQLTLWRGT